jgi:hypothetical protein
MRRHARSDPPRPRRPRHHRPWEPHKHKDIPLPSSTRWRGGPWPWHGHLPPLVGRPLGPLALEWQGNVVGRVREEDDACGHGVHPCADTAEPQVQQRGETAFRSPLGRAGPSGFELYDAACQGCRGVVLTHATAPAPALVGAARVLTGGADAPPVLQGPRSARHGADRPALLLPQELPEGHNKPMRRDGRHATHVHDAALSAESTDPSSESTRAPSLTQVATV